MSGPTGFDYEVMISRLHGGLCAFQSLRAHRRQRAQAAAPPPRTEERPVPEPPRAPRVADVDERADLRATASMQPHAFVAVGDRVVPLFGSMNAGLFGVADATPAAPSDPPAPPSVAPASAAGPAAGPAAEARPPAPPATLRLPPPTLPPQLGVLFGGRSPSPEPGAGTQPPTDPQAPDAPPPMANSAASIAALLDARAQEDARRLERAHAEHHAAMATLLREHREALRAEREADAARTTQLLREVFTEHQEALRTRSEADAQRLRETLAEHRAELAALNQTHADHLARHTNARAATGAADDLRAALIEQASIQREASEAAAKNLDALTSIVADLGQTVGMLAIAATQKAQPAPRSATFSPPPRVEPAAPSIYADPASAASSHGQGAAPESPHLEVANTGPPGSAAPASSQATPAAANQAACTTPAASLAAAIAGEPPRSRPLDLNLAEADRARLQRALADDDEGDLPAGLASDDDDDDDDDRRRRPLRPCTDLMHPDPDDQEPGDD